MDLAHIDFATHAPQLRKPHGTLGMQVAQVMAEKNRDVTIFTLECLQVEPADRVLEIGFGHGEGIAMALLQAHEGFVAGIDFSPDMVEMAHTKNRMAILEDRCELTLCDAKKMPLTSESFNKVFAVNVFHFWSNPMQEIAECLRVLKEGGRMAFFMAHPEFYQQGLRESGVFSIRSPEEVEKILFEAGCVNVRHASVSVGDFKGFVAMGTKS